MGDSQLERSADLADGQLERLTHAIGEQLWGALPSPASRSLRALDDRALDVASHDAALRAALFRFVDVVPACRSLDDLARHLASFLDRVPARPQPLDAAMHLAHTRAGRAALGVAAAAGVRHVAHRFIVGETPQAALPALRALWRDGVASSLDLLGEATVTEQEADAYAARCHDALQTLSEASREWPAAPLLESDASGPVPRANLSVKISALTPLLRPEAPERASADAGVRLRELLHDARARGAHLHIDMESLDSREIVLDLALELLAEPALADGPAAGVVLQAYLRDSPAQLERILTWARTSPRAQPLTVRLVKGAYWDHEIIEARQHGWAAPVFERKRDCDRNFEQLTRRLLDARPLVRVAIASHNLRSIAHAIAYDRLTSGAAFGHELEIQVLRGLGDDLQVALAAHGQRVRAYCPVGDLIAGMAYLVRRLLENTSNDSFLARRTQGAALQELLAAP